MKTKLMALMAAIIFGIIAALGIALYLNSVVKTNKVMGEKVEVYVAVKPIKASKSAGEIVSDNLIKKRAIPRRYVAGDRVTNLDQISGKILSVSLTKNEQLTAKKFKTTTSKGMLPFRLKKNQLAITVPIDKFTGVSGKLNPGDRVTILGTFKTSTPETDFTRILLTNTAVISIEKEKKSSQGGAATGRLSLTLAIKTSEAEKLVYAAERGSIWAALQGAKYKETTQTNGADLGSVTIAPPAP